METSQLKTGALGLIVGLSLGIGLPGGCARFRNGPAEAPLILAQRCPKGPHCVTGQIDDRYGTHLADVRCWVRTEMGDVVETRTDDRGVYMLDELPEPPGEVRFAKDGYGVEVQYLQPLAAGIAARTYVALQQADEANCTCDPAAIFKGQPACPEEKCASDSSKDDTSGGGPTPGQSPRTQPRPTETPEGQSFPGQGPPNEMTPINPPKK